MRSINEHRLKSNPTERRLLGLWGKENEDNKILKYILDRSNENRGKYVPTEVEEEVAATVIQWLGSPVGQSFLAKLNEACDAKH
jgi:hypothetical protein